MLEGRTVKILSDHDFDALVSRLSDLASKNDDDLLFDAAAALTVEREQSKGAHRLAKEMIRLKDNAESRIYNSPHDSNCKFPALGWNCTCWKQEMES